jgi:hypothetical protein
MPKSLASDRRAGTLRYLPTSWKDQSVSLTSWCGFDGERDSEGDFRRDPKMNVLAGFSDTNISVSISLSLI